MDFSDFLRETYGTNTPILSNEIAFDEYSRPFYGISCRIPETAISAVQRILDSGVFN